MLRFGGYKERILAQVFPDLHKEIILGIPWLSQTNPIIDWVQASRENFSQRKQRYFTLDPEA